MNIPTKFRLDSVIFENQKEKYIVVRAASLGADYVSHLIERLGNSVEKND